MPWVDPSSVWDRSCQAATLLIWQLNMHALMLMMTSGGQRWAHSTSMEIMRGAALLDGALMMCATSHGLDGLINGYQY